MWGCPGFLSREGERGPARNGQRETANGIVGCFDIILLLYPFCMVDPQTCQGCLSFNVSVTYSLILSIVVRFTPKEFNTAFKDK